MWQKIKSFLFHNTSTRQTVAKNTFWLTVSNFGGRLLRSVIIIYAARVLGASAWGTFSYAMSLISFLTMFADIGISPILVREVAKSGETTERKKIISTSFVIKLFLVAAGFLLVNGLAPALSRLPGSRVLVFILSFVFVCDAIRDFGSAMARAFEKMEREAGFYLFTNLAIIVAGFLFLHFRRDAASFALSYVTGTAAGMAVTLFAFREYFKDALTRFSRQLVRPILSRIWPFAIASLLAVLLTNTDIVVIGWFRSAAEVGYYSATVRFIQIFYLFPAVIATTMMPLFSRLAEKNPDRLAAILVNLLSFVFLVAFPLAVGGIIVAREVIALVFGSAYVPAAASLQVLLATFLFDFPSSILTLAVFVFDQQKKNTVYAAIGGVLNVVFDLLLIPRFGIVGSAWATFAAQAAATAYLWHTAKSLHEFHVLGHLKKIALATAGMAVLTLGLHALAVPIIPLLAASAATYFLLVFWLKEPVLQEAKNITTTFRVTEPAG